MFFSFIAGLREELIDFALKWWYIYRKILTASEAGDYFDFALIFIFFFLFIIRTIHWAYICCFRCWLSISFAIWSRRSGWL